MIGIHTIDTNLLIVILVAIFAAPLTLLVAAARDRVRAAPAQLEAVAAEVKNPQLRYLATEVAAEAPAVIAIAEKSLAASRDHVVQAVSAVNPSAGHLVQTLIDTALATPPDPILSAAPKPNTTGGQS